MQGVPTLEGLAVIDVVEGTARAALPHMAAVLAARPSAFPSLRAALDWAKRSGAARAQALGSLLSWDAPQRDGTTCQQGCDYMSMMSAESHSACPE